jgi:hypothetical protein
VQKRLRAVPRAGACKGRPRGLRKAQECGGEALPLKTQGMQLFGLLISNSNFDRPNLSKNKNQENTASQKNHLSKTQGLKVMWGVYIQYIFNYSPSPSIISQSIEK